MPQTSISIRLNPFKKINPEYTGVCAPVPWSPHGVYLEGRPVFTLDPAFHAGAYYVQDASSMFVGWVFRKVLDLREESPEGCNILRPAPCVLDLCAAPGGKTTDIAASLRERFGSNWHLTANEVIKKRFSILQDNVRKWGDPQVECISCDPSRIEGDYDIVVADVPCSGEGMFLKSEAAVENWSEENVELCAERQRRIISDIWTTLKPGGTLIYSTCTFNDKENDGNVEWICKNLGGEVLHLENPFREAGVRSTRCGFLLHPDSVKGLGQYCAAVVKGTPVPSEDKYDLRGHEEQRRKEKKSHPKIQDRGKIPAERTSKPDPDSPLSLDFDRNVYPEIELSLQDALKYLHRDSLQLPAGSPAGYITVCYKGLPLGFVKNIGRRANNLLPQSRRILMDITKL